MMSPIDAVQLPLNFDGNGTLRTMATGSKVIIGNYPPGVMYAVIGDVDVYLGPVEIEEAFNRSLNEQWFRPRCSRSRCGTPASHCRTPLPDADQTVSPPRPRHIR